MNVVELKPQLDCEEISTALRAIADDIEAGAYDFDPTTAVVVLGREVERKDRNGITLNFDWQTHGLGKSGFFVTKGLLACAISKMEGGNG